MPRFLAILFHSAAFLGLSLLVLSPDELLKRRHGITLIHSRMIALHPPRAAVGGGGGGGAGGHIAVLSKGPCATGQFFEQDMFTACLTAEELTADCKKSHAGFPFRWPPLLSLSPLLSSPLFSSYPCSASRSFAPSENEDSPGLLSAQKPFPARARHCRP